MAAQAAHDVPKESVPYRLNLLDLLQRPVRVVERLQELDAQLSGGVAKLDLADVGQLAEVAGRATIPESGAAARHRDQADGRPLGTVSRDRRGAPKTLVVGVWHDDHQALAVTRHSEQV
jgi:hypothetical protein